MRVRGHPEDTVRELLRLLAGGSFAETAKLYAKRSYCVHQRADGRIVVARDVIRREDLAEQLAKAQEAGLIFKSELEIVSSDVQAQVAALLTTESGWLVQDGVQKTWTNATNLWILTIEDGEWKIVVSALHLMLGYG